MVAYNDNSQYFVLQITHLLSWLNNKFVICKNDTL